MDDAIGLFVVLLSGLALLNAGSIVLGRALKIGVRPVSRDMEKRTFVIVGAAGLAGLLLCATAACMFYRLVDAMLRSVTS